MVSVGMAISITEERKATVFGIILSGDIKTPIIEDKFIVTNDESDLATQLFDMSQSIRTRIGTLEPNAVVVRRADFPPTGSRKEAPKIRLLAEGAITSAARSRCEATFLANGKEIGGWSWPHKDDLDAQASSLLKTAGLAQKFAPAASAALGALTK